MKTLLTISIDSLNQIWIQDGINSTSLDFDYYQSRDLAMEVILEEVKIQLEATGLFKGE